MREGTHTHTDGGRRCDTNSLARLALQQQEEQKKDEEEEEIGRAHV